MSQVIPRRNLYEQVTDRIQAMIVSRRFQPGDRLPTEQQLAAQFGVSRTAVREAVKTLADRGLVRVRQGQGTFVVLPSLDRAGEFLGLFLQLNNCTIAQLLEARRAIELEAVALAATRRTDEDLRQIGACLDGMRYIESNPMADPEPFISSDVQFHLGIARATRNGIFIFMLTVLRELLRRNFSEAIRAPGATSRTIAAHEQILRALEAGDPDAARSVMQEHLDTAERWVEEAAAAQRAAGPS
jgi:GntR family transcriptional repressor for pyruvate dehydrogenase complex